MKKVMIFFKILFYCIWIVVVLFFHLWIAAGLDMKDKYMVYIGLAFSAVWWVITVGVVCIKSRITHAELKPNKCPDFFEKYEAEEHEIFAVIGKFGYAALNMGNEYSIASVPVISFYDPITKELIMHTGSLQWPVKEYYGGSQRKKAFLRKKYIVCEYGKDGLRILLHIKILQSCSIITTCQRFLKKIPSVRSWKPF